MKLMIHLEIVYLVKILEINKEEGNDENVDFLLSLIS